METSTEFATLFSDVRGLDIKTLRNRADDLHRLADWPHCRETLEELWRRQDLPAFTAEYLGNVANAEGQPREALRWYRQSLAINPRQYTAHEHLIFTLDALPETTDAEALAARRAWWQALGAPAYARRQPHTNDPDPYRPLRVGHISGDFNFHSAGIAWCSVATNYSDGYEAVFYSTLDRERYDQQTRLYQEAFGPRFIDASKWSASMLANTIRDDKIDILIDLSGYTGSNRLLTFAERPAPIQIQAWGYVLGCGWPAGVMDAIFVDPVLADRRIRGLLTEQCIDLPSVLTFLNRPDLPEVGPLPCLEKPPVFSCFQRAMKLNPDVLSVYKQILDRLPEAQIWFKGGDYSPYWRDTIADALAPHQGQIMFDYHGLHRQHMLSYQEVDLALDTWPQTGGVSTLEAAWCGVPTVTLLGPRMIQRASASFMTTLGIPECVCVTPGQYIEAAVAAVTDDKHILAQLRGQLRERMRTGPIMNGYVDAVERAYRKLWETWCKRQRKRLKYGKGQGQRRSDNGGRAESPRGYSGAESRTSETALGGAAAAD